jgi:hypothetical protein
MFGFTEAKSAQRHAMPGVPFDSQGNITSIDAALPAFNANSAIQRGTISILNLQGGGVIPGASGDLLQFQASLQMLRDQGLPKRAARLKANMFASMYGTNLSKL